MSPARLVPRAEQERLRREAERLMRPRALLALVPEPAPQVDAEVDAEVDVPFPAAFYAALNVVLRHGAAVNLGPTRCARLNYLWFVSTAAAYQWTQPQTAARIAGTKYGWNWTVGAPLETNKDQYTWMIRAWEALLPAFVPTFTTGSLLAMERAAFGWTEERQAVEWGRVGVAGNWSGFWSAWLTWWSVRQADGATEAAAAAGAPTAADLPNGATVLDVADATQDPNTFPAMTQWTPLKVGAKIQRYLTWNWGSVASTALNAADTDIIRNAAATAFLAGDSAAKAAEIAEVLAISQTLTDTQKVAAEFWAGGPATVSPPGMMIWFWRAFMESTTTVVARGWSVLVYSGLDLAAHIFETSRLVWALKKEFMEDRPIQCIRALYRDESITLYNGTTALGAAWVPYQETNFVTPPFADFPSGHSAFSQSFACVMTDWFGASLPTGASYTPTDISMLSPALAPMNGVGHVLGTWTFPAGASQIQAGTVPSSPETFSFATWQDMADAAGISRKLGGIHATSAHVGSQLLANALHGRMIMRWGIPK